MRHFDEQQFTWGASYAPSNTFKYFFVFYPHVNHNFKKYTVRLFLKEKVYCFSENAFNSCSYDPHTGVDNNIGSNRMHFTKSHNCQIFRKITSNLDTLGKKLSTSIKRIFFGVGLQIEQVWLVCFNPQINLFWIN